MKVITRCVIDMETLEVVEEHSYDYKGPVAHCLGGGGSSGGGGGSGKVGYPAYMERIHENWLDNTGVDNVTSSMSIVMNSAMGNSPWTAQAAYDPDTDITAMVSSGDLLQTLVSLLSSGTTLDTLVSSVLDHTRIDNSVTEFAADLDARLTAEVIPRFERGMQDINAVMSSAFVIGRALIEENQDRQVAKYSADLHMKAFSDDALQLIQLKLEYQKVASHMLTEIYRLKIVAKKEENETEMKIDEADALWDMEVFQYGGNLLAGIGGGTAIPGRGKTPSTAQSMIGGAMTGAAAGAMIAGASQGAIAGPPGMAIGAFLGAASALM